MGKKAHSPLTAEQRATLENLISGKTAAEAATAAGVEPETVRDWMATDPPFRAELNAARQDAYRAAVDRLRALVPSAIGVLEATLTGPHRLQAAALVLKAAALASVPAPAGSTTPKGIEQEDEDRAFTDALMRLGRE